MSHQSAIVIWLLNYLWFSAAYGMSVNRVTVTLYCQHFMHLGHGDEKLEITGQEL
jgi:hypothetical protein